MGSFYELGLVNRGLTRAGWIAELHSLQSDSSLNELKLWVDDVDPGLLKIRGELLGQCLEKLQTITSVEIRIDVFSASSSSAYLSELVSGLKRNPHPTIENLSIVWLMKSSDTIFISEIIRRTTKLKGLRFVKCRGEWLSDDAAESLASSIRDAVQLNLDELTFEDIGDTKGLFELLRKIFPSETDPGRRCLRELCLIGKHGFQEKWWELFPVLAGNISAISIQSFDGTAHVRADTWWRELAHALKSSPVMSIHIDVGYFSSYTITLDAVRHPTGSLRVNHLFDGKVALMSKSLQDDQIQFFKELFADNLRSSSSITELALRHHGDYHSNSKSWWEGVFQSLKSNTSVTSLDLSYCDLADVHFEHLRSLLRVNLTVEEVKLEGTSWRNDGKAALIKETLARNKKAATEFSILKAAGFEFGKAKVGRIFLCGSPYAGKTQLKLRMMRLHLKRSRSGKLSDAFLQRLKLLELRRTKGAEVEVLMDNKEGQVSVWDLAGQYMYRALHDLILPKTNQSLAFVFAFNPFQGDSKESMKEHIHAAFACELEEWLKFVASNCQTDGDKEHLPQVLVVITHRDLMNKYLPSFKCDHRIQEIIGRFESIFRGVVKLVSKVYHVNAREKKEVKPFLDDILRVMKNWSETHSVPVVCSDISSALVAGAKSFNTSPVWSLSTFSRFCQGVHGSLKNASPEILSTIASYLHDVGRIITVPKSSGPVNEEPLILVDPNWCTETFLGTMIAVGNGFKVDGDSHSGTVMILASSEGFIDEWRFQSLLDQILSQMKGEGIEKRLLEDLLQRLNLCYRFEDGASSSSVRYFVPVICGGLEEKCDIGRRQLQWDDDQTEGCKYLGYRLECKDTSTTFLNKGVFSRFQIKFRHQLMTRFGMDESDRGISCGLGLMRVRYDGYEVLVESDEVNGHHVDIMVKSSQPGVKNPRMRIEIVSFLQKHFLQEFQAFCASSSGCPGITMIVGVLRTSSVQNLIPIRERRAPQHSIALEQLKDKFRLSIDDKLQDMGVEVDEESLLSFQYRWPDGKLELVKETLGPEDLESILSYVRRKVMTFKREVQTCSNELHQMLTKLSGKSSVSAGKSSLMGRNADFSVLMIDEEAGTSRGAARHSVEGVGDNLQISKDFKPLADFIELKLDQIGVKVDAVGSKVDVVDTKINHIAEVMYSVKAELQQLKIGILEMQKVMTGVSSGIDKLIGYSISREDHSGPRRPYFTKKDAGILPKGKAYVLRGQAVQLHFLCEAKNQPHVVQDQRGLPLVITEKEMSWVPFLSEISFKLISTLISIGIQLLTHVQIDTQVLHFANLNTGECLPMSEKLLEYMKRDSDMVSVDPADPCVIQSWSLLHKYLGDNLSYSKYRSTFGLCRVRYRDNSDPYAWICEDCVKKGTKPLKILDELN